MTRLLLPPIRRIEAGHHVKEKLPGSAKSQIIVDDSPILESWIVKSINSAQGMNALVPGDQAAFNEYVGGRLAEAAGLSVAEVGIIRIDDDFLTDYPDLKLVTHGSFTSGSI